MMIPTEQIYQSNVIHYTCVFPGLKGQTASFYTVYLKFLGAEPVRSVTSPMFGLILKICLFSMNLCHCTVFS